MPESELRRITDFIGLPDAKTDNAAALVAARRRHTHFTIDHLIDARVSAEVIELYRALIAEASARRRSKAAANGTSDELRNPTRAELLPGSVSRVNAFVPERIAQIEHLYGELLAQTEARHKTEIEKLTTISRKPKLGTSRRSRNSRTHLAQTRSSTHKSCKSKELSIHLAQTESPHKAQVEELTARYNESNRGIARTRYRMNELLREKNISLAESEAREKTCETVCGSN